MISVEWSNEAIETFNDILKLIQEKWTDREVHGFIERTTRVIELIIQNPNLYPFSKKVVFIVL